MSLVGRAGQESIAANPFIGKRFLKNKPVFVCVVCLFLGRWEQTFIHPYREPGTDQRKDSISV